MHQRLILWICAIAAILQVIPLARAEETTAITPAADEKEWEIGLNSSFDSRYVWRGLKVTDGFVWQPDVYGTYKGITADVWINWVLGEETGQQGDITEVDYNLDYTYEWKAFSFSGGLYLYDYQTQNAPTTGEIYLTGSWGDPFSISQELYVDVIDNPGGFYGLTSLGYSLPITQKITFNPTVSLGWGTNRFNKYNYGVDKGGLIDFNAGGEIDVEMNKHITLSPFFYAVAIVTPELRSTQHHPTFVHGGLKAALTY